jgi:RNA-directed DNA polymerase
VGQARKRCWKSGWVLGLDIKGFFDNIDHKLMMRAVQKHVKEKWALLHIKRQLKAPIEMQDGRLEFPEKGSPQGGVISPLLAYLFLHYVFDQWMVREFPNVRFEPYADDVVCHCKRQSHALQLKQSWKPE